MFKQFTKTQSLALLVSTSDTRSIEGRAQDPTLRVVLIFD
nr:MAG TPA: hypothetical protein [Caudoviricetes sp.]